MTATRFFKSDFIIALTVWHEAPFPYEERLAWIARELGLPYSFLRNPLVNLREHVIRNLESHLREQQVPESVITWSREDRAAAMQQLSRL